MDLAHSTNSAVETRHAGTTRTGRAKFAAGVMTDVVITALLATALVGWSSGKVGSSDPDRSARRAAAIEFRAGERVLTSGSACWRAGHPVRPSERQSAGR